MTKRIAAVLCMVYLWDDQIYEKCYQSKREREIKEDIRGKRGSEERGRREWGRGGEQKI